MVRPAAPGGAGELATVDLDATVVIASWRRRTRLRPGRRRSGSTPVRVRQPRRRGHRRATRHRLATRERRVEHGCRPHQGDPANAGPAPAGRKALIRTDSQGGTAMERGHGRSLAGCRQYPHRPMTHVPSGPAEDAKPGVWFPDTSALVTLAVHPPLQRAVAATLATAAGRSSAPTPGLPVRQSHHAPITALMRQELEHVRSSDLDRVLPGQQPGLAAEGRVPCLVAAAVRTAITRLTSTNHPPTRKGERSRRARAGAPGPPGTTGCCPPSKRTPRPFRAARIALSRGNR
jgi:hypothetical protein